ncbi:kinase-like domain-containing protein [Trichoderma chlorosporum]
MNPSTTISDGTPTDAANNVEFAVFSAHNEAAIHLLESIQCKSSPPALKSDESTIGYQLSLPLSCDSPDSRRFRWRIGAGASPALIAKGLCCCEPDILLCPPGKSPGSAAVRRFVKDIHATVHFHPRSGVLLLKTHSSRPVIYEHGDIHNGDLVLDGSGKTNTCVLRRQRNFIRFGQYRFALEFVIKDEDAGKWKTQLDENLRCFYHGSRPSQLLNFIPTPHSESSWNVWLHQKIPNTSITSGVNIFTGQPVAIKKVKIKARRRKYILHRLQFACQYKDRLDKGVLGVIDAWCEHKTSPPCLLSGQEASRRCRHMFYSMPLAEHHFLTLPWLKIDTNNRLFYFHQTLVGLAELHRQGITHGNISPESLLVLADPKSTPTADHSLPKKAVIALCMQQLDTPNPSVCVAPEIWENSKTVDWTKADVWALAASWLFAFVRPPSGIKITEASYQVLHKTLSAQTENGLMKEPFAALIRKMLAWEPDDRPSATELLADISWESVLAHAQLIEDNKKRKRMEKMQLSPNQPRRVRLLSPDVDD